MSTLTTNLQLVKPEMTDNITPTIFADNFDKIDSAFYSHDESITELKNKTKIDLLWENASSGSFAAQMISLDLENYDFVKVQTKFPGNATSPFIPVSSKEYNGGGIILGCTDGTTRTVRFRNIDVTPTGIYFDDEHATHTSSVENGTLVPIRIYGVKL